MGKKNKSSSKSSSKVPDCTCDHPYTCTCGKRPPRPSKGHKWDPTTKAWGGKGHKQKGGSGQTSSVSKEAVTTQVGKTKLEQWQRLPTNLLEEVCKREGRPRPKYKSIGNGKQYKYRVIVQDAKASKRGTDHDIILVPATGCQNEEQAREEAALLALLHLTPSLPHERKLPEPYKTTWLHALSSSSTGSATSTTASEKKPPASNNKNAADKLSNPPLSTAKTRGAAASTNLKSAKAYVSVANKRQQQQERAKARRERIRKHEAIRMANRDHQVFLSAACRKQIEALLRGESSQQLQQLLAADAEQQDSNQDNEEEEDDLKAYVLERLAHEGFTLPQARTAYSQVQQQNLAKNPVEEDEWDRIHDECIQWLCIHLSEDQLPEGFDPRGGTLDVVLAPNTKTEQSNEESPNEEVKALCSKYGISKEDATLVLNTTKSRDNTSLETTLWKVFSLAAEFDPIMTGADGNGQENLEMAQDEIEALQAIFMSEEECRVVRENGLSTACIKMQPDDTTGDTAMSLTIVMRDESYPSVYPESILLTDGWSGRLQNLGGAFHVQLLQFVRTSLTRGEPMVYEIYGKAQELLLAANDGEMEPLSLMPMLSGTGEKSKPNVTNATKLPAKQKTTVNRDGAPALKAPQKSIRTSKFHQQRRPRPRSFFWSKKPRDTPPAVPFPKLSVQLEKARKSLPAARSRSEFLSALDRANKNRRVVLVTGATGSGKTTQIPQFILEENPVDAKIVVAQPRRLAATGVASRVANERGEAKAGIGSVGHVVRGDSAICKSTRLLFCTTGVLLRQLQCSHALDSITHLIIDEVHERHLDTDILLGVLKASLHKSPNLRLILMSATIDEDRFASYFGEDIPRMHIEGRTFPVTDFMLEDVLQATGYVPPKKGKKKKHRRYNWSRERNNVEFNDPEEEPENEGEDDESSALEAADREMPIIPPLDERVRRVDETNVDYDLIGRLAKHLIQTNECGDGSILVFLPGAPEINMAIKTLQKILRGISVRLLPLHGGLQPKDQRMVFLPAEKGWTKLILATNIAETSITIQDCTVVIDCCREKQLTYDPSNRMPLLVECFASKSSLKQRRGRAGRVRSGKCFKLISHATLTKLAEHGEPEIRRCALDQVILSLLFLGLEDGTGRFLRTLLDPPGPASIQAAIISLERLGAVSKEGTNIGVSLTALGMHLAGIPAPPTVGKLCILGCILGCRRAALAMAAGMSIGRNPFLRIHGTPVRRRQEENGMDASIEEEKQKNIVMERKTLKSRVGNSDHALLAAAYLEWENTGAGAGERKRYCNGMGLDFNGMRDMKQLVTQLDSSLTNIGYHGESADDSRTSWRIVRACAVGALAPGQLVKVRRPSTKYSETHGGAVEREGNAKEIKLFLRGESGKTSDLPAAKHDFASEERVFIHPSSSNFDVGSYDCPWLVYHELVRTSKAFLRDSTECSAYALLLFGGELEVQAAKGLILIDQWVRLSANPRIGALIGGLRRKVDELLLKKVQEPSFDIGRTAEMRIISNLLVSDGLGH